MIPWPAAQQSIAVLCREKTQRTNDIIVYEMEIMEIAEGVRISEKVNGKSKEGSNLNQVLIF